MKIRTAVFISEIEAILPFASTDETRFVLNGVCFEVRPDGAMLVATDGRRLAVIACEAARTAGEHTALYIVPTALLQLLGQRVRGVDRRADVNTVIVEHDSGRVSLIRNEVTIAGKCIGGTYPNWRMVIPQGDSQPVGAFALDFDYIKDFQGVADHMSQGAHPTFRPYGELGPLLVRIDDVPNFVGVLMPIRHTDAPTVPKWLGIESKTPQAVVA